MATHSAVTYILQIIEDVSTVDYTEVDRSCVDTAAITLLPFSSTQNGVLIQHDPDTYQSITYTLQITEDISIVEYTEPDRSSDDIVVSTLYLIPAGAKGSVLEAPTADFSANKVLGGAQLEVIFTDKSLGSPSTWEWDFGDGSDPSYVSNPTHTYTKSDTYTVTLTVTNVKGTDTKIETDYITVTPTAAFSADPESGRMPLEVTFTDESLGSPSTWEWDFGDGSDPSYDQNPTHQYEDPGFYTIVLSVTGDGGSDSITKIDYIAVTPAADFSADVTSGRSPLEVEFTDESLGSPSTWEWDFGDGSDPSYDQNPTHEYEDCGIYAVTLTVTGEGGSDSETKEDYIAVIPTAAFSADVTSGSAPLNVEFTNESTGSPTSWEWDFGDGSYAYEENTEHEYKESGIYTVTLTVAGEGGSDSETKTDYITVTPTAAFSSNKILGKAPSQVKFIDESLGSPSTWEWDFGDGSPIVTVQNPTHIYEESGVYTVTLEVTAAGGQDTEIKVNYITISPTPEFSADITFGKAPLEVAFTDLSIGSPTSWEWDFGDDSEHSLVQNPTHTYTKSGVYTVKLTAIGPGGGESLITKTNYIKISPTAAFSADPISGKAPLEVTFIDESTGEPTDWFWDFGDGNTSIEQSPVHTYNRSDVYTVTLTVAGVGGEDLKTETNHVSVAPKAEFAIYPESGYDPLTVEFVDESIGEPTSWLWNFGDPDSGVLNTSTEKNPLHTFSAPGVYTVILNVSGLGGVDVCTKDDCVEVSETTKTTVCFQVFTDPLEVVIRNPTHRFAFSNNQPLLKFSTIGEDSVCDEQDCVRIYIDNTEVPAVRVGEAYGYDYYGADNLAGWKPEPCEHSYGYDDLPDDEVDEGHGYGHDDGYGQDGIPGTIDDTYGSDRLPGTLHTFELPEMEDGIHTVRAVVRGTSGLESESTETFIIDTTPPVINVISPLSDLSKPAKENVTLLYTVEDFSGVANVNVNIDGIDYGWLPSGTVLDFLKSGAHTITIEATDIATGGTGTGNKSSVTVEFNLLKSIVIDKVPAKFYVGTNASTKEKTADAIVEEFRILNTASTDDEVLEDFKLLRAKIQFQLRKGSAVLTADEVLKLQKLHINGNRINIPTETLMLCHYDTNVNSLPGIDNRDNNGEGINLSNSDNQIIDPTVAGHRIDVTAYYYENSVIDRELITELIKRIAPAFVEVGVIFKQVQ